MKRAFTYTRVSSEGQVDNASLPTQREAIRRYAEENGIEIVREYVEEGITRETLDRPALDELRSNLDQVDTVIMFDPDRMGRKLINQLIVYEELEKVGVSLEFVKGGIVGKTPEERMMFEMRSMIAQYELSKIKERNARGKRQRARNGLRMGKGANLYGYTYIPDTKDKKNGYRVINPETGNVVKQIFKWYLEGETLNGLSAKLHALGISSPTGKGWKPVNGKRVKFDNPVWSKAVILGLLRNRAYTGESTFMGEPIKQPALISKADFERVQAKLARNKELSKRNAKNDYLLSGFVFCSECGRRYAGHIVKGTRFYQCTNSSHRQRVNPCRGKGVKADTLEEVVWSQVEQTLSNPDVALFGLNTVNDVDYEPELINLKARQKHLKHERSRLFDAFRLTIDEDTFKAKMDEIARDEEYIQKRLAEVETLIEKAGQTPSQADIERACEKLLQGLENLSFQDRRELLEALKIKVHAGNGKIRIEGTLPIELSMTYDINQEVIGLLWQ